jgi:hypothetical protein
MSGFMEEVNDTLNNIFSNYIIWLRSVEGYTTLEDTEEIRNEMTEILDFVLKETDPMTIARLQNLAKLEME